MPELTNLLASSDHRQRLFALDILLKTCQNGNQQTILTQFFDPELSGVSVRLQHLISGGKIDAFRSYCELFNCLMEFNFADIQEKRIKSYVYNGDKPGV